jgi:hypothetical protein
MRVRASARVGVGVGVGVGVHWVRDLRRWIGNFRVKPEPRTLHTKPAPTRGVQVCA